MATRGVLAVAIVLSCMQAALWPAVAANSAGRLDLSRRHLSQRKNIVTAEATSYAGAETDFTDVCIRAIATAVAEVQGGGLPIAAAEVAAASIAEATATAVAKTTVHVDVQGSGVAFGGAAGKARATAAALAHAIALATAVATNGDETAVSIVTDKASAVAIADALAFAESQALSTGGSASAHREVTAIAVARVVASALAEALAYFVGAPYVDSGATADVAPLETSATVTDVSAITAVPGDGIVAAGTFGGGEAGAAVYTHDYYD